MDSKQLPPFRAILTTSIILFLVGGIGLVLLFNLTVPTLGPRWLLFFLVTLACSGISLPFIYLLNRRIVAKFPTSASVMVREALFVGIYIDLMIWLQFGKVLNFALGAFLLAGFGVVELLLRMRERTRFKADLESD